MKYKTLQGKTCEELDQKVDEYLQQGWDVHGQQYVHNNTYYQPMVFEYSHEDNVRDDGGISPQDIGTLALLQGLQRRPYPRRRW